MMSNYRVIKGLSTITPVYGYLMPSYWSAKHTWLSHARCITWSPPLSHPRSFTIYLSVFLTFPIRINFLYLSPCPCTHTHVHTTSHTRSHTHILSLPLTLSLYLPVSLPPSFSSSHISQKYFFFHASLAASVYLCLFSRSSLPNCTYYLPPCFLLSSWLGTISPSSDSLTLSLVCCHFIALSVL